jgi:hypothetical protein
MAKRKTKKGLKSKRSVKTAIYKNLTEGIGGFDKTAIIGLLLLLGSFALGIITRNSAYLTNEPTRRLPFCDSYISWLCIPTTYVTIPLGPLGSLVINMTSFLSTAVLFILGVVLVRNRSKKTGKPGKRR